MQKNLLYNIQDLKCSYREREGNAFVLQVENLQIPVGVITFFVGPSGVGKSTILETLGVMNDTIQSVEKFEYKGRDLSAIWSWQDSELSAFRNKEFSFIFQDTNLMPNFTALENIMITGLLQGLSVESSKKKAYELMSRLGVPMEENRSIEKYSGGQRQRIAFARAILPKFNVLFGDEPTGNLDAKTADDLMTVLKDELVSKNASAIIVSHDLNIATKFADIIVNIQNGYIDNTSIYTKSLDCWENNGRLIDGAELIKRIWK